MNRHCQVFAAIAAALLVTSSAAGAQATSGADDEFNRFFVGTWSCADTVGDHAGKYTTTISRTLDDHWLRQTYAWAPTTEEPKPLGGEYLISYDPRVRKWIRMGAMTDGMYFAMTGARRGDTLTYGYVLPSTSGTAVYIRQSDREYHVRGPSYPENGKMVTERHTCRRSSPGQEAP